jgi:hypothetical protein
MYNFILIKVKCLLTIFHIILLNYSQARVILNFQLQVLPKSHLIK